MSGELCFDCESGPLTVRIATLLLAGFAGRDRAATERHIADMEKVGVPRPACVPAIYPVIPALLSQADRHEVYGTDTTPEVEFVLFGHEGEVFVTVGNDQCDIAVEAAGMAEKSKNLCQKVVARHAWPLGSVKHHWDSLVLHLEIDGRRVVDEPVSSLQRPNDLTSLALGKAGPGIIDGAMLFSGTVGEAGPLPKTPYRVRIELIDPLRHRSISHEFEVVPLQPHSVQA